ncbi:hypothetical protein KC725_01220 [Candidatus Peregrinibacteria bacterium]|nr:hypothetical protein [Candidatus Peregrinibacteria bacterium]
MKNAFLYKSISSQSCRQQFPDLLHNKRFVFADDQKPANDNAPDPEKAPEKAEKPRKAAKESPDDDRRISYLTTDVGSKAQIFANLGSRSLAEELKQKESNKETAERLKSAMANMQGILDLEKKSKTRTKQILEELIHKGQIEHEQAKKILNMGPDDSDFDAMWSQIIDNPNNSVTKNDLTTIKREAYEFEKLEARFKEANEKYSEVMREALDSINLEAQRQRNIDIYSRRLGFPLKRDQIVHSKTYRDVIREDGTIIHEPIYRELTIKDVYFDDPFAEEEDKKIPSITPMVAVQIKDLWEDENGHEMGEITHMSVEDLKQMADLTSMVEPIETDQDTDDIDKELKELSTILGVEVKEGDTFEYRELHEKEDESTSGFNRSVRIINIHKKEDPFLQQENSRKKELKETYIELDQPVVVENHPQIVSKSSLTMGEFARWYKRIDALKPMSLKEVRDELEKENRERNNKYERKSKMYPPVTIEEGEVLYYDTDPPRTFVIKRVDTIKDQIHLDSGSVYTPATFLAWVRRNEVEKMTPEAQAEKMTEHLDDVDPRKKAMLEKARKEAEEQLKDRVENPPQKPANDNQPPEAPSASAIGQLWNQTRFLSLGDMWEMGKEIVDYVKRYLERMQKGRIGAVGYSIFPGRLGGEFKALAQQAENESVQRYMQSYEQYGYGDLYDRLRNTNDKDELKAILQSMSAKGWIIWNDPVLLEAISRIGRGIDDSLQVKTFDEEKIKSILDAFWGDSTYIDFKHKNESAYNSIKNSEKEGAAAFESDPNGKTLKVRLQSLLHQHINGEWVDRARYEAYLEFAIAGGKLSFADKVYFLIMGVGAQAPADSDFPGRTLLDMSRIGALAASSSILSKYPIIEFFAAGKAPVFNAGGEMVRDKNGDPVLEKINKDTFKHLVHQLVEKETGKSIYSMAANELNPTEGISNLTERTIMRDRAVRKRLSKASGDVSNWDHDDMHEFGAQLDEDKVKQLVYSAGGAQRATPEGIKNTIVGMNNYMSIDLEDYLKSMEKGDVNKANGHLKDFMKRMYAFQRLHALLDRRFDRPQADLTRFSRDQYNDFALVDDSRRVITHMNEMNDFMRMFIEKLMEIDAKSFRGLAKDWDFMNSYQPTANLQQRQQEVLAKFSENFNKALGAVMEKVGPEGVYQIIESIQGRGDNKTIKGILKRSNKQASEKEQKELVKFDYEGLTAAQETVAKIERLELALKAAGGKIDQAAKQRHKKEQMDELITRIKQGEAMYISDQQIAMLEGRLRELESVLGDEFEEAA